MNCAESRATTACAAAFAQIYTGGYPCHEDIGGGPADDFFIWSTPADPAMMPWRCARPEDLRAYAAACTPNEDPCVFEPAGDRERWWCEQSAGSYGVRMMTLGFSIGKAGARWRKRERDVISATLVTLRAIGMHAKIDADFGWIVLTDHQRPYRA